MCVIFLVYFNVFIDEELIIINGSSIVPAPVISMLDFK